MITKCGTCRGKGEVGVIRNNEWWQTPWTSVMVVEKCEGCRGTGFVHLHKSTAQATNEHIVGWSEEVEGVMP